VSFTPPSLPAGHRVTGAELAQVTAQIVALSVDWTTWTPTLSNLTQGNGTVLARYLQVGKLVHYRFVFTLGTTSAVGTAPRFTLPVAPLASYTAGIDQLGDVSELGPATNRRGIVLLVSGSTVEIFSYGTTGAMATTTATVPFTWATGHAMSCTGAYEAA